MPELPEWMKRRMRTRGGPRVDPRVRIEQMSVPQGECRIWTGQRTRDGYGAIGIGRGQQFRVHRIVWEIAHGAIPAGLLVCHTCDTPLCVNVDHLFLGTPLDNTRDMVRKGRRPTLSGEFHPSVKLTDKQVKEIIDRRTAGEKLVSIAADYGVSFGHISSLYLRGRKPTGREAPCHS